MAGSLQEALSAAQGEEVMIIGGGQLYAQAMPHADRMILTQVDCAPQADTWFPAWKEEEWCETDSRSGLPDEKNPLAYRVVVLTEKHRGQSSRAILTPCLPVFLSQRSNFGPLFWPRVFARPLTWNNCRSSSLKAVR